MRTKRSCLRAIHSPAHLLRAGIGPAGDLKDMGIPVRHALFGVGQRLMDHPSVALASFLNPHASHEQGDAAPPTS